MLIDIIAAGVCIGKYNTIHSENDQNIFHSLITLIKF